MNFDKTVGYYLEKYLGFSIGLAVSLLLFNYVSNTQVVFKDKYYDLMIKVSSSIFGFLITILTLMLNSSSKSMVMIKEHRNYKRLINFNKVVIFLMLTIILLSLMMFLITSNEKTLELLIIKYTFLPFKIMVGLHTTILIWGFINTVIFVRIFYSIILSGIK